MGKRPALEVKSPCGARKLEARCFFELGFSKGLAEAEANESSTPSAPVLFFQPGGALVVVNARAAVRCADLFDAELVFGGGD